MTRYAFGMSTAADRKRARAGWTGCVFRGPGALDARDRDARREAAEMDPLDRLALVWELSLEQYGGADDATMEPRLPRSAYLVVRR